MAYDKTRTQPDKEPTMTDRTKRPQPPRRDEVKRRLIMIELDAADSKTTDVFEAFVNFADDWDPDNVDVSLTLADEARSEQHAIDVDHLTRQMLWSEQTFGPGDRTYGVIDHIAKELQEVANAYEARLPTLPEWVDVIILALDGAWRSGATPAEIIAAVKAKQTRNEARTWPDWRTASPDQAIEHDRSEDTR